MQLTHCCKVGAGPAGLISALVLAKNGIKPRIVDRDDKFHVGSRGFGIQPRTFELFQTLGIVEDLKKLATPIPTMRAYKLPGGIEPVKTWDLYEKSEIWPDRPYANGACLSQAVLEKVIRAHLEKYGVTVELNKGLIAIEQDADVVTATIAIHRSGVPTEEREVVVAKYLIGADGAKGSCRKLLGFTFGGETRDSDGMVWGDVEIQGLTNDYWHIWGKPGQFTQVDDHAGRSIMARPLSPSGNTFGIGITGQNFDPTELAQRESVISFIRRETGRGDLEFGEFSWLSYFKPNMRMVNKFHEGRAFLVGDSAHVHSPTGGQGMNCSVQDASNLGWKLALVIKGLAPPSLLLSYTEERLPVIAQMLHATTALYTHTVAKERPLETPVKEASEGENASGWFRWRNSALEMYGINYRYSEIVLEQRDPNDLTKEDALGRAYSGYEGHGNLRAGDRAPDAPGLVAGDGTETSLFGIFKVEKHTVLVFTASGDADNVDLKSDMPDSVATHSQIFQICNEAGTAYQSDVQVLHDRDGHARGAYFAEANTTNVVIVRPDGFVGAIVRDQDGVRQYFSKIFY
ncbi:hypothetical protein PUNSTDRAFT_77218 [Punctularia strigosozonata HHB-11173 SS5]|uniref:Uncharacterized protein n=1 Tax=Punctularia strigosozonata (strain HHB-11173) TaxID=741275 RepID=R7S2F4_PUNST|nr:uncharacterized protein PUNSTDRAFT_77218 [Punctularia strigosozonata HHB-11173 SS5]EIN04034.1 hypothetical protein PUNSTDRAFT_77218 [Punctularia strigosozonata HHB-11173 SS5]